MDYYVLTNEHQVFRRNFQGEWERLCGSLNRRTARALWLRSPGPANGWKEAGWFHSLPLSWRMSA